MTGALSTDEAAVPIIDLILTPDEVSESNEQLVQFGKVLPWV